MNSASTSAPKTAVFEIPEKDRAAEIHADIVGLTAAVYVLVAAVLLVALLVFRSTFDTPIVPDEATRSFASLIEYGMFGAVVFAGAHVWVAFKLVPKKK